jgi:hypothetical protein
MKTREDVSSLIKKELPVGASRHAIENFLKQKNISFSWDRFTGKYVGIIRNVEPYHSITIDIFVDDEKRFVRADVRDSYTAP